MTRSRMRITWAQKLLTWNGVWRAQWKQFDANAQWPRKTCETIRRVQWKSTSRVQHWAWDRRWQCYIHPSPHQSISGQASNIRISINRREKSHQLHPGPIQQPKWRHKQQRQPTKVHWQLLDVKENHGRGARSVNFRVQNWIIYTRLTVEGVVEKVDDWNCQYPRIKAQVRWQRYPKHARHALTLKLIKLIKLNLSWLHKWHKHMEDAWERWCFARHWWRRLTDSSDTCRGVT